MLKTKNAFQNVELFARELLRGNIEFCGQGSQGAQCARLILVVGLFDQFKYYEATGVFLEKLLIEEQQSGLRSQSFLSAVGFFFQLVTAAARFSPSAEKAVLRYRDALLSTKADDTDEAIFQSVTESLTLVARTLVSKGHEEAANTFISLLDFDRRKDQRSEEFLNLRDELANAVFTIHKPKEAVAEAQTILTGEEEALGHEHSSTLKTRSNLAFFLAESGVLYEAEDLNSSTLLSRHKLLGDVDEGTLVTQSNHGHIQFQCGHYLASEQTLKTNVAHRKFLQKRDDHNVIHAQNRLAKTLLARGLLQEAENVLNGPCPPLSKVHSVFCRRILTRAALIAQVNSKLGRYAQAKHLANNALCDQKSILGPTHPDTLSSMYDLATIHHNLQELDEAQELASTALEATRAIYGWNHPMTLDLVRLLGMLFWDGGSTNRAEMMLRKAFEGRCRIYHAGHAPLKQIYRDYVVFLVGCWKRSQKVALVIR